MDKQTPTQMKIGHKVTFTAEQYMINLAQVRDEEQNRIIKIIKKHLSELEFYNIDDKFFQKYYSEEELLWKVEKDLIKKIKGEHK